MKDIIINGVRYEDVPYISIPKADGDGEANFYDTESGDVQASDIRQGKKAWANGVEVTGTVTERSDADLETSGATVTVPAGIYDTQATATVDTGDATPTVEVSGIEIGDAVSEYPITITPKATVDTPGYITRIEDGATVTKYIQTEEKTVTPTIEQQTVTPTAGKLLSEVTVQAVQMLGNAQPSDVMAGKTFYNDSLELQTGTATVPIVGQDPETKALTIS